MTQPRMLGGRYELDGIVGRGGMAEVFRGRDIRLDRIVAIKTLRDDLARDQTFQARFRREAQSAASLNQPSIVAVYDTGEDMIGSTLVPYIVMEYVDGRTLRDLLRDDRRLLPERAAEITDGVLRALDYSHRNGIVHRDIKPGNVMLTRSGEVKVMDFGIARAVSDAQATMTQTAQVIGTAQYLSPEQARGERVDARSDLYSAGCLLYELLTGRPPFTGDSPVAIAYQHVRENPVPPSQVDPEVPPWGDWIVLKAMAKDPADRYQSAGEMRNDLQRALSGVPLAASMRPDYGGTRRLGSPTQVAGATSAIPPYSYGPPDDQDPGPGRPRRVWPWVLAFLALLLIAGTAISYHFLTSSKTPVKTVATRVAVPQVAGLSKSAAEQAITQAHLKVGSTQQQNSSTVSSGTVISSNPAAGQQVAKQSPVNLVISSGQVKSTVPFVFGGSLSAAETALAANHLNPKIKYVNSTQPANTVVSQHPQGNTIVPAGSTVTLDVSSGGVQVPSVLHDTEAEAKAILQGAGFKINPVTAAGPAGFTGTVFQSTPMANAIASKGSTVTVFIAQPPIPTQSPTVTPAPNASTTTPPA